MKNRLLFTIAASVAAAACVNATVVLDENFNSPAYSAGNLVGQNGWTQVGATATNPIQVSGGEVLLGTGQDATHAFSSSITAGTIYYTAKINYSSKGTTPDYSLHLSDGGTSAFGARLYADAVGSGFQLAWAGSSTAPTVFGAELAFDTDYTIIFQYNIVAGLANDTGALYVTTGSFDPIQANNTPYQTVTTWTGGTEVTTFAAGNLRQGGTGGSAASLSVDDFKVGTTWADVVPEPTSASMLFGGVGMILWSARRKRFF